MLPKWLYKVVKDTNIDTVRRIKEQIFHNRKNDLK